MKHEFGVYVGRFQPFHNAHLATVKFALDTVRHLVIVVGSDNQARNVRNPWTTAERVAMIKSCLAREELERVSFVPARDYLYNDNLWVAEIQRSVAAIAGASRDVVLVGHRKDETTAYLKSFPQWSFIESGVDMAVDATKVRDLVFSLDKIGIWNFLPEAPCKSVVEFMETDEFKRLHEEHHHVLRYKSEWAGAPFPPTFVTVDAVVLCSGHLLVVRRKGSPGKGLVALPGGFLNFNERIVDGCIRELKEETSIKVHPNELRKCIVDEKVFDHPLRSLRGRTITHAFCIDLGKGELPQVKGTSDADKAWWTPLSDVWSQESSFFEDHFHIATFFAHRR